MFSIKISDRLHDIIDQAISLAELQHSEYVLTEHLLLAIARRPDFQALTKRAPIEQILSDYLNKYIQPVDRNEDEDIAYTQQLSKLISAAANTAFYADKDEVDIQHILQEMISLKDSFAGDLLRRYAPEQSTAEFLAQLSNIYGSHDDDFDENDEIIIPDSDIDPRTNETTPDISNYVVCLNDHIAEYSPLVGREKELERTIQTLCRYEKNNPLHVGDAGVGKTALARGLAMQIEAGNVPDNLKGCRIYELDATALIAGTSYRGEYEKRLKTVLRQIEDNAPSILYIDEIHNLIGAGTTSGSNMDASNMLKPYLQNGKIRIMGSTSFDEYNRFISNAKTFARLFSKIDIVEPDVNTAVEILSGIKSKYEKHHNVKFTDAAIRAAVDGAAKYITTRRLPDSAIDLIDETGAASQISTSSDSRTEIIIDKDRINATLSKMCGVERLAEDANHAHSLLNIEERIKSQIFGQDTAVASVCEATLMAEAGLNDDNKPMASLLFVGPTGVGKTEIARVLASTLNVPLIRFDMSEYAEKHTVAKLIGSPAGYVGHEEGGLLTDAVTKSPSSVLLFDEIEKAHPDIYNILLQVMDYASLTDSRGRKADFKHTIIIMTTNAGAQFAANPTVGFDSTSDPGQTMLKSVKSTFKPEFLNRLTKVVVFNSISKEIAEQILNKKLNELTSKIKNKQIALTLTDQARTQLLTEGFSAQNGGREIERVISSRIKPILMHEILFGALSNGGEITIDFSDDFYIKK